MIDERNFPLLKEYPRAPGLCRRSEGAFDSADEEADTAALEVMARLGGEDSFCSSFTSMPWYCPGPGDGSRLDRT